MLKVWGRNNSINVQKVMWAIAELELAHERIDVGGPFGGLDTQEYGKLNPNRLIPVLEDGSAVIWESQAIVRYLASKYGSGVLWPEDPAERAKADQWMDWKVTRITPDLGIVFLGLVRTSEANRDMAAIERAAERLAVSFTMLDKALENKPFIAGQSFNMGDIPVGAACYRYRSLDIVRPDLPHLARWYESLQERAAFRDHVMIPLS